MILVYRSYSLYLGRIEEQQKHIGEMARLHLRTIEALALAIDAKDDTTAAHLRRVQIYASEIGRELRLSEPEMQALEAAALLHDVGKLAVPEYIISKPGKLTPEEFEKMKVHPVVGAEILQRVDFPTRLCPSCARIMRSGTGQVTPTVSPAKKFPSARVFFRLLIASMPWPQTASTAMPCRSKRP